MRVATCLVLLLLAAPAFAQVIPRTAEGRPDFHGAWDSPWATPQERPAGVASLVVSEAEAVAMVQQRRQLSSRNALNVPSVLDSTDYSHLVQIGGERRTSQIVDPPDGKIPWTALGLELVSKAPSYEGPETAQLQSRCLVGSGAPPMFLMPADTLRQIVQTEDAIVVLSEMFNDLRIVPVGGVHRPPVMMSIVGDPVGRWEGDSLVIESTNFRADMQVRTLAGNRVVLGAGTKVVEHLEFIAPDELLYRFTVSDPLFYARPWTGEYTLVRAKGRLYEVACHEGNYALANILRGARIAEQRPQR